MPSVHIWHPHDDLPDDQEWLTEEASRHHGELANWVMLSNPLQQYAVFPDDPSAHSFVAALNATGRWRANYFPGETSLHLE